VDFKTTNEQDLLANNIIKFARNELNEGIEQRDANSEFNRREWHKCAEIGICGLTFPEEYGGGNADLSTTVNCIRALSYGCQDTGLVLALITQICCGLQLHLFGKDNQKEKYLPPIISGEKIAAQAISESDAGSDVGSMRTTAIPHPNGYRLNGTKMYITNGPIADIVLVIAKTGQSQMAFRNLSCFIVTKETSGFSSETNLEKMGLRTMQNSGLIFENCDIPAEQIVGNEGQGMFIFNEMIEWERILMAACYLGVMQRIYETTVNYAKTRNQFGKPIGQFQAVSSKIADMRIKIELGKLIIDKAAWQKDQKIRSTVESSIAKVFLSESLKKICADALQIHGAYGYMKEAGIERDVRNSFAATISSGASEIQRNIIAKLSNL